MIHVNKHYVLAMILLTVLLFMCPITALGSGSVDESAGVYEGEYDANGIRSGFGTWAYHNYLYVGNWENDMPSGEGTLYYWDETASFHREYSKNCMDGYIAHGNWYHGVTYEYVDDSLKTADEVPSTVAHIRGDSAGGAIDVHVFPYDRLINNIPRAANARETMSALPFNRMIVVPPWGQSSGSVIDSEIGTPWHLYESYLAGKVDYTPLPEFETENIGLGATPGNLANGNRMALLGDRIVMQIPDGNSDLVYMMRADGTQTAKVFEYGTEKHIGEEHGGWKPNFQVVGDELFMGKPYRMQSGDATVSVDRATYFSGLILDEWEYRMIPEIQSVVKIKLDFSDIIDLGYMPFVDGDDRFTSSPGFTGTYFVDPNWVYVWLTNPGGIRYGGQHVIVKLPNVNQSAESTDSETEIHTLSDAYILTPQVVNGKLYYVETKYNEPLMINESELLCVDADFLEPPVTLVPRSDFHNITSYHVTDDAIYYGVITDNKGSGSIMRADLDGGNPTVLADGFETGQFVNLDGKLFETGSLTELSIAGDWMMFNESIMFGDNFWHLMRLDGTGLHKVGDAYVPKDASGITDSTGKWRYEILPDGTAKLLGPGSKLKFSGKLALPATVDKIPVTAIGENAFYGYDAFTSVTIPKSVTKIGDYAFFWCKGLTSATIPEGVTHIGEGAFQYCEKLKKLALPASLVSVGSEPFANCDALRLSVAKKSESFQIVDGALVGK